MDIHPARYLRNQTIITTAEQATLLKSTVAQVGLGGLGGTLLEMFLRAGVGRLRGADGDTFEASNLNRQALSTPDTLGVTKTEAASKRATQLNPSIDFQARNEFLDKTSLPDFIKEADLVVDALGGLETRPALQAAASDTGIPLVTGALAGWTGYVGVVMPGHPGPADIMGTNNGAEEKLGCPIPSVNFMASLMATEAVKLLTTGSSQLASAMLVIDLKALSFDKISL